MELEIFTSSGVNTGRDKAQCNIGLLGAHLTTVEQTDGAANHVGKAMTGKNKGGRKEATSPYNGIHRYLADVLFLHPSG